MVLNCNQKKKTYTKKRSDEIKRNQEKSKAVEKNIAKKHAKKSTKAVDKKKNIMKNKAAVTKIEENDSKSSVKNAEKNLSRQNYGGEKADRKAVRRKLPNNDISSLDPQAVRSGNDTSEPHLDIQNESKQSRRDLEWKSSSPLSSETGKKALCSEPQTSRKITYDRSTRCSHLNLKRSIQTTHTEFPIHDGVPSNSVKYGTLAENQRPIEKNDSKSSVKNAELKNLQGANKSKNIISRQNYGGENAGRKDVRRKLPTNDISSLDPQAVSGGNDTSEDPHNLDIQNKSEQRRRYLQWRSRSPLSSETGKNALCSKPQTSRKITDEGSTRCSHLNLKTGQTTHKEFPIHDGYVSSNSVKHGTLAENHSPHGNEDLGLKRKRIEMVDFSENSMGPENECNSKENEKKTRMGWSQAVAETTSLALGSNSLQTETENISAVERDLGNSATLKAETGKKVQKENGRKQKLMPKKGKCEETMKKDNIKGKVKKLNKIIKNLTL